MINASVCWLKKVKLGEISPERNKAELCPGCWLAILLSLFFYCMRSDEWNPYNRYQGDSEKNGDRASKEQLCPNLSPFYNCPQLQLFLCFAQTHTSHLYLNPFLPSSSLHSFFLDPAVLSPLLRLHALLLASPYTGSHLCTSDTLINPGFVLLQKGVGRPSGSTLIAVWEQTRIVKYLPLFSTLVILYSLSHPPALHH